MIDYTKKQSIDGDGERLGVWHKAALRVVKFAGQSVLDVGCGSGAFLKYLKQMQPQVRLVAGIDPNPGNIRVLASQNIPATEGFLEGREAEFSGKYSLLTCFEVVEHLYSPKTLFDSVYAILSAGGKFVVSTPNAFHIFRQWTAFFWQEHRDPLLDPTRTEEPEHVRLWSYNMLKRGLLQAGFTGVKAFGFFALAGRLVVLKNSFLVRHFAQHLLFLGEKPG